MWHSGNSTGVDPVQIEPNGHGGADVWLHMNIEEGTDGDGNPKWEYDETHGVVAPAPTVAEVEADFAAWWDRLEDGNKTDHDRVVELTAQLAKANERAETHEQAIVELAELIGGE